MFKFLRFFNIFQRVSEEELWKEIQTANDKGAVSGSLLYGVVEWLNDHPKLDGMKSFTTKGRAIEYGSQQERLGRIYGFNTRCTIIRIEQAI